MNTLGDSLIDILQQENLIRVFWRDALRKTWHPERVNPDYNSERKLLNVFADKLKDYFTMRAKEIEDKIARDILLSTFNEYDWNGLAGEIILRYNLFEETFSRRDTNEECGF